MLNGSKLENDKSLKGLTIGAIKMRTRQLRQAPLVLLFQGDPNTRKMGFFYIISGTKRITDNFSLPLAKTDFSSSEKQIHSHLQTFNTSSSMDIMGGSKMQTHRLSITNLIYSLWVCVLIPPAKIDECPNWLNFNVAKNSNSSHCMIIIDELKNNHT